jgi:hypothetical protein
MRADRFDERIAENVARARTSVPPAVAKDATVDQSTMGHNLPNRGRTVGRKDRPSTHLDLYALTDI